MHEKENVQKEITVEICVLYKLTWSSLRKLWPTLIKRLEIDLLG